MMWSISSLGISKCWMIPLFPLRLPLRMIADYNCEIPEVIHRAHEHFIIQKEILGMEYELK
jgi:hypothetical protein